MEDTSVLDRSLCPQTDTYYYIQQQLGSHVRAGGDVVFCVLHMLHVMCYSSEWIAGKQRKQILTDCVHSKRLPVGYQRTNPHVTQFAVRAIAFVSGKFPTV